MSMATDGGATDMPMMAFTSILDFIPPTFPPLPYDLPPTVQFTLSLFALFIAYNNGPPTLTYLSNDRRSPNSVHRMQAIAAANNDPLLLIRLFPVMLERALVEALVAQKDVEKLRTGLSALLPAGPEGVGWQDTERWKLSEIEQRLMVGQLTELPFTPPEHCPYPHYATEVFVHHLSDYIRLDDVDSSRAATLQQLSKRRFKQMVVEGVRDPDDPPQILLTDTDDAIVHALGPGHYIIPQSDKTLLHFVKPHFPAASSASASAALSISSSLIAIFSCFDGGAPMMYYVDLPGNEAAVGRLRYIADHSGDSGDDQCDQFTVQVFTNQPLSSETVQQWMAMKDVEQLRSALTMYLPAGPEGDGWGDRNMWTVGEISHEYLPGQVALLPLEAPAAFKAYFHGFDAYASQLFTLHLQDFVRITSHSALGMP